MAMRDHARLRQSVAHQQPSINPAAAQRESNRSPATIQRQLATDPAAVWHLGRAGSAARI